MFVNPGPTINLKNLSFLITLALLSVVIGCGKKAEPDQLQEVNTRPLESDLKKFLDKQQVVCEAGAICPTYISKIVIVNGSQIKYCTGFLVKSNVVATSSSCLPGFMRFNNLDCSTTAYFFFGRSYNRMPQQVGCKKVLQASSVEGSDPALWRDDVAFLELDESLDYKRALLISREGIQPARTFTLWGIEQMDDTTAFIRRDDCEGVVNSYVYPLSTNESSPNVTVAGCAFKNGFTGAALIDSRGKLRGTVSQDIPESLKDYIKSTNLLVKPLKAFMHVTNFACVPTIFDNETLDYKECQKDISPAAVDNPRTQMFSTEVLFGDMKAKVEASVAKLNPYIAFEVSAKGNGDQRSVDIYPKCFKKVSDWIWTFSRSKNTYVFSNWLPQKSFKRMMDSYGKIQGLEINSPDKEFNFQMSLKALRNSSSSHVWMWDSSSNPSRIFEDLVDCKI